MEGCDICTLSPSIDGHLSHISIFLLTKFELKESKFWTCDSLSTSRVKIEGCESCPQAPSID